MFFGIASRRALGALALGLAAAAASGGRVEATPATLGFYPSSDIYARDAYHFDVDSYGRGVRANVGNSVGLTRGFGPETDSAFGRIEGGFDYFLSPNELDAGKRLLFNAKAQLYNNPGSNTRVVAGFWGLGSRTFGAPNVGYVLAARTFDFGRIHVGLARSFQKESVVGDDRTNLHLAFDRSLSPRLAFVIDYYTGKTTYSGVQPTLYYSVNPQAAFGIGYFRGNNSASFTQRNQIYLSFDYNFGGRANPEPAPTTAPNGPAPGTESPVPGNSPAVPGTPAQ